MFVTFCVLSLIALSGAFHTGAPDFACDGMTPGHYGAAPQTGRSPYTLTLSKTNYRPRESIKGTLSAAGGATFKGFLIEPRVANRSFVTVGRLSGNSPGMQSTCGAGKVGLTHTNNTLKSSVSFTWAAPDQPAGDVVFVYTVVKEYSTFWVKMFAPALVVNKDAGVIG